MLRGIFNNFKNEFFNPKIVNLFQDKTVYKVKDT